jgi:cytoskeletal protein CcmA (bactofilin family)
MAIFGKDGRPTPEGRPMGSEATLSVIAQGLRIVGDILGPGMLKVDGQIEGSIAGSRQVIIGRDGSVRGNVEAAEVILAGSIEGSVLSADRVEVQGSAVMNGDIQTRVIVVHEGAQLNGAILMGARMAMDDESRPAVQVVR